MLSHPKRVSSHKRRAGTAATSGEPNNESATWERPNFNCALRPLTTSRGPSPNYQTTCPYQRGFSQRVFLKLINFFQWIYSNNLGNNARLKLADGCIFNLGIRWKTTCILTFLFPPTGTLSKFISDAKNFFFNTVQEFFLRKISLCLFAT